MNFIFYHNNLKFLTSEKLSIKKAKEIGSKLILDGMKEGYDIKKQIGIYIAYINQFQRMRLYQTTKADQEYYLNCILALYKLEILDPESPTDPIYIAPLRKKKKSL